MVLKRTFCIGAWFLRRRKELKTLYPQTGIIERTKVALPKMEFTISFSSPPQEPYLFQKGEGKLFTKSSYAQLMVSMLHPYKERWGGMYDITS